ncbi:Serine/threonine kinase [Maublancomyces gigas]|uniref:Serine/threonine kinase n=1 Tax=Discina gigas TaxID=1032678 RepID=A0ABR3GDS6_9PEZI
MADKLLQDVYRKIEREKVLMNGARAMRNSTENAAVQQRLDSQIREFQRNLSYLEERYNELQNRVIRTGMDSMNMNDGGNYGGGYQQPQLKPPNPPFAGQQKTRANFSKLGMIYAGNYVPRMLSDFLDRSYQI